MSISKINIIGTIFDNSSQHAVALADQILDEDYKGGTKQSVINKELKDRIGELATKESSNKGLFQSDDALKLEYPQPKVGDWAIVTEENEGNVEYVIWRCDEDGTWTSTHLEYKQNIDLSGYATKSELNKKQDSLKSGVNIKTINSMSLLGEGNIEISGGNGTAVTQLAGHDTDGLMSSDDYNTLYALRDNIQGDLIPRINQRISNLESLLEDTTSDSDWTFGQSFPITFKDDTLSRIIEQYNKIKEFIENLNNSESEDSNTLQLILNKIIELEDSIDDEEARATSVEVRLTDDITNILNRLAIVEGSVKNVPDYSGSINTLNTRVTDLEAGLSATNNNIDDIEDSIADVKTDIADINIDIAGIKDTISNISGGLGSSTPSSDDPVNTEEILTEINSLKTRVGALERTIGDSNNESELADIITMYDRLKSIVENINPNDDAVADLIIQMGVLSDAINSVKTKNVLQDGSISTINGKIDTITTETIPGISDRISALELLIEGEDNQGELQNIKLMYNDLKNLVDSIDLDDNASAQLIARMGTIEGKIANIEAKNEQQDQNIESVDNKIDTVESTINSKIASIKTRLSVLETTISGSGDNGKLLEIIETYNNLKQLVDSIDPNDSGIADLINEVGRLGEEITNIKAKNADQDLSISGINDTISSISGSVDAINTQTIPDMGRRISALETAIGGSDDDGKLQEIIETYNSLKELVDSIDPNDDAVASLITEVGRLGEEINNVKAKNAQQDESISNIAGDVSDINTEISTISGDINTIKTETLPGISSRISALETVIEGEGNEGELLNIIEMYNNLKDIVDSIDPNTDAVAGLIDQVGTLKGDVTDLQSRISALENAEPTVGGDGTKHIILTSAQYNALSEYENNAIYFIVNSTITWGFGDGFPIILTN